MAHPTLTPTEITNTIVQDNIRLAEHATDLEKIMSILKDENLMLKEEIVKFREQRDELVKQTDTIEVVYDADLPLDVKKIVKKRVPKKKVVKPDPVLVDSLDVSCVCVAPPECLPTDTSIYDGMKKPELIEFATGLGLKGIKKLSRANIVAAVVKHNNGGVVPIMDMVAQAKV